MDPQDRLPDPSDLPPSPPDLGGGTPLDIDLGPARQQRPRREPPPPPPPDDLRARDQLGLPARSGVNAEQPEEEGTDTCPRPDEGGGYTGLPTRGEPQHGIGLHSQPAAAPIHYTPGEPLLPNSDILDANALRIPREPKPRPNVNPGFDLGAARMDASGGPGTPQPNAGGVGGENAPPSPPPPPKGGQVSSDHIGHEGGHEPKPPKPNKIIG